MGTEPLHPKPRALRRSAECSRAKEIAEATLLAQEMSLSDDADQILALMRFLRRNDRARIWIASLLNEDRIQDWARVFESDGFAGLNRLGVRRSVAAEIEAVSRPATVAESGNHGGLTELQVLLLLREHSSKKSRIGLDATLLLRLWLRLGRRSPVGPRSNLLENRTSAMWQRIFVGDAVEGLRKLSAATAQLTAAPSGKNAEMQWRADVLRYVLKHPRTSYYVAEIRRAIPAAYAPRERKDVVWFCRKIGLRTAGRRDKRDA